MADAEHSKSGHGSQDYEVVPVIAVPPDHPVISSGEAARKDRLARQKRREEEAKKEAEKEAEKEKEAK
ncbi:hypothetical protein F53441_8286 [Fusarium austroafricanum]|uniref:Uncharacterized protein n=1 Tax=Fusarium austroafricanum TaxID=2364996 RepID=A0A8H4KEQ4_9HYPO|nr:hypothetical protein F53441_8286 [Fusarium austroafricanum]